MWERLFIIILLKYTIEVDLSWLIGRSWPLWSFHGQPNWPGWRKWLKREEEENVWKCLFVNAFFYYSFFLHANMQIACGPFVIIEISQKKKYSQTEIDREREKKKRWDEQEEMKKKTRKIYSTFTVVAHFPYVLLALSTRYMIHALKTYNKYICLNGLQSFLFACF